MYLQWRGLGVETKSLGFFANFEIENKVHRFFGRH
jgi:hypothetical protein